MKRPEDDIASPFPYVFPQMPPRFRRCRFLIQTLFWMEWLSYLTIYFTGLIAVLGMLFLGFFCRWMRHTPRFFWHCPCCGSPFPYYAPPLLRGMDDLKEADRLHFMESKRIRYVKTSTCPLIIPSVCPECKCRFFDMADTDRQI